MLDEAKGAACNRGVCPVPIPTPKLALKHSMNKLFPRPPEDFRRTVQRLVELRIGERRNRGAE